MQGPHQVAHMLMRVTFPFRLSCVHFRPLKSINVKPGKLRSIFSQFCAGTAIVAVISLSHLSHACGVPPVVFQSIAVLSIMPNRAAIVSQPERYCSTFWYAVRASFD